MTKTKKRLRMCCTLLALNLVFIWGNSLLPGQISGVLSDFVKSILDWLLPGNGEDTPGGGLLRKLAHFTEFACLGSLLFWLIGMLRQKRWELYLWPMLAGVAVAAVDETIQCFVPDRGPGIKDVLIDSGGVLTGIILLYIGYTWLKKKTNK